MQAIGNAYLRTQIIASDEPTARQSIMFDETHRLSVSGAAGSVTTELLRMDSIGMTLGRVQSSGHEIELKENSNVTLLIPSAGILDIRVVDRDYRADRGRPIVLRPTERRTRASTIVGARFRATTLQVSMDRLRMLAATMNLPPETALRHDASALSGLAGKCLARQLPQLADDLLRHPEGVLPSRVVGALGTLIDEQLCCMLCITAENQASRSLLPAYHRVRQAEELMRAHSDEPLSMLQVAESLGVSLRSLQLALQEVHDLGPRDILNRIRLEKARRRLLAGPRDAQVTTVALDSGFFHLSRFAQAYAKLYGERPSETLARRRA